MNLRHEYIAKFGFAVIDDGVIEILRKYQPIVEIGAGSGYWGFELRKAGIDIIPTDPKIGRYWHGLERPVLVEAGQNGQFWEKEWITVEKRNATQALIKYPDRTLLTVWPDYDDPWTGRMLQRYKGKHVIYVGEGKSGCTGNKKFHQILEQDYEMIEDYGIPQFDGIHDTLKIYERKKGGNA
jgi:hypothetical protein